MTDPAALERLVQRIAAGGRLVAHARLNGGVSTIAHRVDLERADGTRLSLSVRRSSPDPAAHSHITPEKIAYEWDALKAVRAAGVAAPEPLLLDIEGEVLGTPGIVLSFVPGSPRFPAEDIEDFADEMAEVLAGLHSVTPDRYDLSALREKGRDALRERIGGYLRKVSATDPLARRVHDTLERAVETIELLPPALIHGDAWCGNTIWHEGRPTFVDWGGCGVGDPRADVCELRVDLALSRSLAAADAVLAAYERRTGPLPDLWFWDLYRGLEPLVEYEHWLEGYADFGHTDVTPEAARDRMQAFVTRALDAAG